MLLRQLFDKILREQLIVILGIIQVECAFVTVLIFSFTNTFIFVHKN